eukprot:CAMPEP_0197391106 /NCGR_PEP_ID=MMETSP1165-20131217/2870_1 /TAXON_ID=284809 /ORGANISM="Chrysocystis fragilis, Strain CCMP3189" /LENGTH=312 /DNA_ID=CAMNT_0042916653 /DNA_START=127 /DNA_END=1065 /DNA_ORIENTATION=+
MRVGLRRSKRNHQAREKARCKARIGLEEQLRALKKRRDSLEALLPTNLAGADRPPDFVLKLLQMFRDVPEFARWQTGTIILTAPRNAGDEMDVLKNYFRSGKFTSFQRQLTNFGFRIAEGESNKHIRHYVNKHLVGKPASALLTLRRAGRGIPMDHIASASIDGGDATRACGSDADLPAPTRGMDEEDTALRSSACAEDAELSEIADPHVPSSSLNNDKDEDKSFIDLGWVRFSPPWPTHRPFDDEIECCSVISLRPVDKCETESCEFVHRVSLDENDDIFDRNDSFHDLQCGAGADPQGPTSGVAWSGDRA